VEDVVVGDWVRSTAGMRGLLQAASDADAPTREASRSSLDGIDPDHQGVAARVRAPKELDEAQLARWEFGPEAVVVVLDGITDPHNLGAAARAAEAAGVDMLVTRIRRAAGITPAAVRASAGALLHLPLARVTNLRRAVDRLKEFGFTVVGLDASAPATIYDAPRPNGPLTIVLGSEGGGVSRLVLEACDLRVALPLKGRVESLNASAALAAALYGYVFVPGDG
jgi:23S rRNA (guanosine2251-2'-O)-methyltransferase